MTHFETTVVEFQPSTRQWRYLFAVQDALVAGRSISDRAICQKLRMSRQTLFRWRQEPGFRHWFRRTIDQTDDVNWATIVLAHSARAAHGSIRSAEFVRRIRFGAGARSGLVTPVGDQAG